MGGHIWALRCCDSKSLPSGVSQSDDRFEEARGEDGDDICRFFPIYMHEEYRFCCHSLTYSLVHCKFCRPDRPAHSRCLDPERQWRLFVRAAVRSDDHLDRNPVHDRLQNCHNGCSGESQDVILQLGNLLGA